MRRENNKAKIIWAAFIGFIMISSVFGVMFYGFTNPEEKLNYKGTVFTRINNGFTTEINKKQVPFSYFPTEVENINIDQEAITRIKNTAEVDMTYDPDNAYSQQIALIQYNIEPILADFFNIYIRKGFTTNNSYNIPIIDCSQSTSKVPVLYFKESNTTRVYIENDCIIAEAGKGNEFLKISDRILYGIFGIIE
tara:strand:+ start:3843 stop:4424 length:582 start_codon:yes stop_codon:yes gene_type:complete